MKIKSEEFRAKHLDLADVWAWSTDLYEPEDSLVAIPMTEEALLDAGTLMIRASFETVSGDRLQGLMMYALDDQSVFAIDVLDGSESFVLNKSLPDWGAEEVKRLASYLDKQPGDIMPIRYSVAAKDVSIPSGFFVFEPR